MIVEEILRHNAAFVESGAYDQYAAGKYPKMKAAVLTCMDTRLVELLPAALGIKNGDVKMVKNAGGVVLDDLDSTVRSLLVAVYELQVEEILVIGHTDCGVRRMDAAAVAAHMKARGITDDAVRGMIDQGLDFEQWFCGFEDSEDAVRDSVLRLRNHPLMPSDVGIQGFLMDVVTGELKKVTDRL